MSQAFKGRDLGLGLCLLEIPLGSSGRAGAADVFQPASSRLRRRLSTLRGAVTASDVPLRRSVGFAYHCWTEDGLPDRDIRCGCQMSRAVPSAVVVGRPGWRKEPAAAFRGMLPCPGSSECGRIARKGAESPPANPSLFLLGHSGIEGHGAGGLIVDMRFFPRP